MCPRPARNRFDGAITSTAPPPLGFARRTTAIAVALVALTSAALAGCSGGSGGDTASSKGLPAVELTDLRTGKAADWDTDRDGKPMVVNLWASWCTPCRKEMPAFDAVAKDLDGKVAFVGITDDANRKSAVKAADASGVSYPLRYDEDAALLTELDISGLPATVFVDADGKVVGKHLGAMTEQSLRKEIEDRYGISS